MEKISVENIHPDTIDKVCRTCLWQTKDVKSLFSSEDNRFLCDMLLFVANIEVKKDDRLPKQVCAECEMILYKADAFKRRCLESEAVLNDALNSSKIDSLDSKIFVKNELKFSTEILLTKSEQEIRPATSKEQKKTKPEDSNDKINIKTELNETAEISEFAYDFHHVFDVEPIEYKSEDMSVDDIFAKYFHKDYKNKKYKRNNSHAGPKYCKICNLEFASTKDYKAHKALHEREGIKEEEIPKFQCHLCMRKFTKKASLIKHIEKHEENANVKFTCQLCKREFQRQIALDKHLTTVHTKRLKSFPTENIFQLHKSAPEKKTLHNCKICSKSFYMMSTLKDHIRTHTGEKPYLCSICGKGFSQKNNLAQHMRRHQGEKPFKCSECDRGFVSKGELQAHKRKHTGAHPFLCDDCGNGFTTSSSLVKHRRTHTGERPYPCDMCPMRFAASGTLKNHRRTHTGEKPFHCSYCEKAFTQKNDLVSHIRCHTGERPYVCSICGQSFRKASALKSHTNLHCKEPTLQGDGVLESVHVTLNQSQ